MNPNSPRNSRYLAVRDELRAHPRTWLVTGVAGFIGSNLLQSLLELGQQVVGLDNFQTGFRHNLEDVRRQVGETAWRQFTLIEGDITCPEACLAACREVDFVLHQAALGSVPRSLQDPQSTHRANVDGFTHMLLAARDAGVQRFVFASSSSVYGDHPGLPKVEDRTGMPLSPYAASKAVNELYARVYARSFGIPVVGLRYFNVFGPRQNPQGPYAAVIPRWIEGHLRQEPGRIFGDGETSRDFCYVQNVVQANLLAAMADPAVCDDPIFNVACGDRVTLVRLMDLIQTGLGELAPRLQSIPPEFLPFREGDVRHSQADVSKAREFLGYAPTHSIETGLRETLAWYVGQSATVPLAH